MTQNRGRGRVLLALTLLIAGCAVPPGEAPPTVHIPPTPPTPPAPPRPPPEAPPPPRPAALRDLPAAPGQPTPPAPPAPAVGRPRSPIAAQAIDLTMRCAAMDERRHTVQADVEVRDGEVRYLRARLAEPHGGSCEFSLNEFRQTRRSPSIELQGRDSPCILLLWEQGPQVVLAYRACERHCIPPGTSGKILPILFDRRVGRCD